MEDIRLMPMEEIVTKYYFRFSAVDRPGVLSNISGVLGANDISIAAVIQKGRRLRRGGSDRHDDPRIQGEERQGRP